MLVLGTWIMDKDFSTLSINLPIITQESKDKLVASGSHL
jgi:hypothetical protein